MNAKELIELAPRNNRRGMIGYLCIGVEDEVDGSLTIKGREFKMLENGELWDKADSLEADYNELLNSISHALDWL